MKASCVLCGQLFEAIPDVSILNEEVRNQQQFASIGHMTAAHVAKDHRKTVQRSFDDPQLVGPLPIPALVGAVGMCAQNAVLNAHLVSEDAAFQAMKQKMIDLVVRGMRQVEPSITLVSS
jgi:hypothetical protein